MHQPWATLIAQNRKHFETRSWPTNYRGSIAIHAGIKCHDYFCEKFGLNSEEIPKGAIVAIADLVDCVKISSEFIAAQSEQEILAGDWQPGRFAWQLKNIRAIIPIPMKGKQGLWNLKS